MAKTIPSRVLVDIEVDGIPYKPDQAVAFEAPVAKRLKEGGQIDLNPEAVKYVVDNGATLIEHAAPKAEQTEEDDGSKKE